MNLNYVFGPFPGVQFSSSQTDVRKLIPIDRKNFKGGTMSLEILRSLRTYKEGVSIRRFNESSTNHSCSILTEIRNMAKVTGL